MSETMVESSVVPEREELVEIEPVRHFEVWVRIKKSSKYYDQGLVDPTNRKSKAHFFKLESFHPSTASKPADWEYLLRFNSNQYPPSHCEFYLVDPKDTKRYLRIA